MKSVAELLAAIATIAKGNATDPAVIAELADLKTQMAANNAKLVANDADDAESKQINADQQVLIEALIHQLENAPPPVIPVVSGVSPNTGAIAGGETFVLSGTGFTGVTAVNFGDVAAESFTVDSDTQITAVSAAQDAATVSVTVVAPSGTSVAATANEVTFA